MQDVKLHRGSPVYKSLVIYGVAGLLYFAFSLAIWWNVWSTSPTSTATCGCGDPALFMWFLQWPAFALTHGKSIFFSTYLFHPTGINLLSNTSVLAIGVPLAPITLAFGPVATLNVASTLAPVMSSLAARKTASRSTPRRVRRLLQLRLAYIVLTHAHGRPVATAREDLLVEGAIAFVVAIGFAKLHHRRVRAR